MDLKLKDSKMYAVSASSLIILGASNYMASTPIRFLVTALGLLGLTYTIRKLQTEFNLPLAFIRRESINYWSGAFGGLLGLLIMSYYFTTGNFETFSLAEYFSQIGIIAIYVNLLATLFMGGILKDVKEGYIEIE